MQKLTLRKVIGAKSKDPEDASHYHARYREFYNESTGS